MFKDKVLTCFLRGGKWEMVVVFKTMNILFRAIYSPNTFDITFFPQLVINNQIDSIHMSGCPKKKWRQNHMFSRM